MTRPPRLLDARPLRTRSFRDLWIGTSLGGLGQQVANVAVLQRTWELTRSPLWTGTIGLATAVPMTVWGSFATGVGGIAAGIVSGSVARVRRSGMVQLAAAESARPSTSSASPEPRSATSAAGWPPR